MIGFESHIVMICLETRIVGVVYPPLSFCGSSNKSFHELMHRCFGVGFGVRRGVNNRGCHIHQGDLHDIVIFEVC